MSSSTNRNHEISLSASLHGSDPFKQLTYLVENLTENTVYLFDRLHDEFDGKVYPLIETNYATIQDGRLILSRQIVDVPDNMEFESFNIPFVTPIKPGGSMQRTINQVQPVSLWSPYSERNAIPPAGGTRTMEAWFRIGYFLGVEGTAELAQPAPTDQGTLPAFDPFPVTSQKTLETGPVGTLSVYA